MSRMKLIFAAAALCGGFIATGASAMPIAPVPTDNATNVEQVHLVCNEWGRCWRRPNYYGGGYGYYARPRYYGGYGGYGGGGYGYYGRPRYYGGGGYYGSGYGRRW